MKVLLTGASSFTGYWFARTLSAGGHQVTATFRSDPSSYDGVRGRRVQALQGAVEPVWPVEFGDTRFVELAAGSDFDLLLHHGAEMANYRSWDFDPLAATRANVRSAREVLTTLASRGCGRLIVTGTVFEPFEGVGDPQRRAFNPYGLAKHLSFEVLRMEAERLGLSIGKFVIPNPFGPLEEMRFTSYLAREWWAGRTPTVATPAYIRDNIHVSLLAAAYGRFCEELPQTPGLRRSTPSGYVESQGAFARRVAREVGLRTNRELAVIEAVQAEFPEPFFRTNDRPAAAEHRDWSEDTAWSDLVGYYEAAFGD